MQKSIVHYGLQCLWKFNSVLNISGDTLEEALNACLRWNIAQTFEKYIKKYTPKVVKQTDGSSKIFTEKH